jgi:hypothetical protein
MTLDNNRKITDEQQRIENDVEVRKSQYKRDTDTKLDREQKSI